MKKIFVNGTFDILHPGHIELLTYAKSLGDYLLVALDSDSRIKKHKGTNRPINDLNFRKTMMVSLKPVNRVVSFDTDDELSSIIKSYKPDIMLVGSDWKDKPVIGSKYANKLLFFDRIGEYSTTAIINKLSET